MAAGLPEVVEQHVFVNCPFDPKYKPLFDAIVFTVHDLGFQARHALVDNTVANRLTRIAREIASSRYSIHDLSRIEVSGKARLPRFNMPFEAGIAYCLHEFAQTGIEHHLLLLDAKPYRYQASLSDVAGLDAKIHAASPQKIVENVREFLNRKSGKTALPGAAHIWRRYSAFLTLLPVAAKAQHVTMNELRSWGYVNDLQVMMTTWIAANPP